MLIPKSVYPFSIPLICIGLILFLIFILKIKWNFKINYNKIDKNLNLNNKILVILSIRITKYWAQKTINFIFYIKSIVKYLKNN